MVKLKIPEKNTPRWLVFAVDIFIALFSLLFAYLVRFDFIEFPIQEEWPALKIALPVFILVRGILFFVGNTYKGIVRHTSTEDTKRIFIYVSLGTLIFFILVPIRNAIDGMYFLPISIIAIEYLCTLFLMITLRIMVKLVYHEQKIGRHEKAGVIIYGAGEMGLITKRTIDRDANSRLKVEAFIDDNENKKGKSLEGVPIFHASKLKDILKESDIKQVIVAMMNPDPDHKRIVIETCLEQKITVLTVPPVKNWMNGQLSLQQIKKVKIEDLLGRKPIQLDKDKIAGQLNGKRVLVTGGAGSIGSEIVRQLLLFSPAKVFVLDQAESDLYDLENELKAAGHTNFEIVVGDVRNEQRMHNVFASFHPQVIFHAAAYKHVPMMEENPTEAVLTNVGGTKVIADLSEKYGVEKVVLISTDKAVNPTNVMGASKRIAEIYAQTKSKNSKVKFITTRFGNVLGSNGSVIPLFRKQIEAGQPLTVTHPDVTRYFMTIPEACQLVLEAGAMGNGGEIFIFDMGKSVKIVDLAKKMIELSGLELGKDIEIKFTGLRPGEKLYEELLNDKENTMPTHHPQIMIARVREYNVEEVNPKIDKLIGMFNQQDNQALVGLMKDIVPEFKSNNSVYEQLDKK